VLSENPEHVTALNNYGAALKALADRASPVEAAGLYGDATKCLGRAARLEPDYSYAYANLAATYLAWARIMQLDQAIAAIHQAQLHIVRALEHKPDEAMFEKIKHQIAEYQAKIAASPENAAQQNLIPLPRTYYLNEIGMAAAEQPERERERESDEGQYEKIRYCL
jgi:hypothetical protein